MSPRARYRATHKPAATAAAARSRWPGRLIWLAIFLGYAALLWYLVFPWVDQTFVNQPAV